MPPPVARRATSPAAAAQLADDAIAEVIQHLSPADVVRAGAVCRSWRRAAAAPLARRAVLRRLGLIEPVPTPATAVARIWRRTLLGCAERHAGRAQRRDLSPEAERGYEIFAVAVSSDHRVAVAGGMEGDDNCNLEIFDLNDGNTPILAAHDLGVGANQWGPARWGVAWSAAGDRLVLGARGYRNAGFTRAWRVRAEGIVPEAIADVPGDILALSRDGGLLAAIRSNANAADNNCHAVELLDIASGSHGRNLGLFGPTGLVFSADGSHVLGLGWGAPPEDDRFWGSPLWLKPEAILRVMRSRSPGSASAQSALSQPAVCILRYPDRILAATFTADVRGLWLATAAGTLAHHALDGACLQRVVGDRPATAAAFTLGGYAAAILREEKVRGSRQQPIDLWQADCPGRWRPLVGRRPCRQLLAGSDCLQFSPDGSCLSLATVQEDNLFPPGDLLVSLHQFVYP